MSSNNATRAALAVASGLALGLAFPKFDYGLLAWVAFVPLFYVIEGESLRRVFWWAYLQGFASYVVSLYWIPIPLHDFADVRMEFAIFPMLRSPRSSRSTPRLRFGPVNSSRGARESRS